MTDPFLRFPRTPHLAWLADGTPRDDKVLTLAQAEDFLSHPVVIEEKIDGANIGISFDDEGVLRIQNRGSYMEPPYVGQFDRLNAWLSPRVDSLFDFLGSRLILFGEWCAVRHSLDYSNLPDWFLGFDVYDRRAHKFVNTQRRDELLLRADLFCVRRIDAGVRTLAGLKRALKSARSAYRMGAPEGFYIRIEDNDWLIARAKMVTPEFAHALTTHWRRRSLERNRLAVSV